MSPSARATVFASVIVTIAACVEGGDDSSLVRAGVSTDTIGDTIVVTNHGDGVWDAMAALEPRVSIGTLDGAPETVFGDVAAIAAGPDGSVYILDRQAAEIRVFDRDGRYVRTVGRRGQGPGEIARPSAIAVSRSGRLAARDFSNARLQVWSADGTETWEWPVVSSRGDSRHSLWIDDRGVAWVHTPGPPDPAVRPSPRVLVRVDSLGGVIDTLPDPAAHAAGSMARYENASTSVPYLPRGSWAVHPDGSLIVTTPDGRGVDVVAADGTVLRILRDAEPVRVSAAERSDVRDQLIASMQRFMPEWTWADPPVPEVKARVVNVYSAWDGRIWVQVAQPSMHGPNPAHDPDDAASPEMIWTEPTVFEVFERDGTFLGSVGVDTDLATRPAPEFVSDYGWGVVADEFGLQRVVRVDLAGARVR